MDKETLNKINTLTRREFSENELYTFSVILCDNDIDRDGECFSDAALEQLKSLFIGKTGIFDHSPTAANQSARIYDTEIVTDTARLTKYGQPYKCLKASAYMVRTNENSTLITEIDGGIKKEVSISCSAASKKCSVCGCELNTASCSHTKGIQYGDRLCYTMLDNITDAYEWSFVAVPAQINAGVTKKFNIEGGKKMESDFTPITTQEDFDAAVQERINAAVEDTKKAYEGWSSPEEVSQLNERCRVSEARAVKMKAASEFGIPLELSERLSGETEEDIRKDAESFAKFLAPKLKPTPRTSGDAASGNSRTAAQLEMLHEINNN